MMKSFIFVQTDHDSIIRYIFSEFSDMDNVSIVGTALPFSPRVNGYIADALNRWTDNPFLDGIICLVQRLFKPLEEKGKADVILFTNNTLRGTSVRYLKRYLRKNPQVVPVLFFLDKTDSYMASYAVKVLRLIPEFKVYSFDRRNADFFSWNYFRGVYSRIETGQKGKKSDIYFSFSGKGRLAEVAGLCRSLLEKGVDARIIFAEPGDYDKTELGGMIHLQSRMLYPEILKDVESTNCILEVLQEGQEGTTLRYYEALCYNKKLLTTNRNISKAPFYDQRYMKVFKPGDDLSPLIQWIITKEDVDYKYDDRFSPKSFIEQIENDLIQ